MMKLKKGIALMLSCAFMFAAASCKTDNTGDNNNPGTSTVEEETELKETQYYLVKDGKTDYTIVYPEDRNFYEDFAITELQTFFYEATGVTIPAIVETEATYSETSKYISVGPTEMLDTAGVTHTYEQLKEKNYKLVNKGSNLFLVGGTFGTPSAVYDFLEYQFKFHIYASDEIYIEKTSGDVKLLEYDMFIEPDLLMVSSYAEIYNSREEAIRMSQARMYEVFLPVESTQKGTWHNFLGIFAESIYNNPNRCTNQEEHDCINDSAAADKKIADFPDCVAGDYHPEWFSNGQLNLCIAVDEMTDILVEYWKDTVRESEALGTGTEIAWSFTAMDTRSWSNADSSMEMYEKYKSYAAEYIQFVNEAARKFNPWIEQNYPDRHIRYCIFAYQATVYPPIKYDKDGNPVKDSNGNYMAADDSVKLEDNVTLFYAPLNASFYYSFEDEENKEWDDVLDRWMPIMDGNPTWYWLYFCNFEGRLVPLDFSHMLQTNMQWAKEHNGEELWFESDAINDSAPNWSRLQIYLMKELGQDVNADFESLVDDFFIHYFKDASEPMKKFYDEFRAHFAYIAENTNLTFGYMTESMIADKSNWSYGLLSQWLAYIDEAYETIAEYETTDKTLYQKLYDRINLESLTIRYMMLDLYPARLANKSQYVTDLINDCAHLGVKNWSTAGTVSDYLKKYYN